MQMQHVGTDWETKALFGWENKNRSQLGLNRWLPIELAACLCLIGCA